MFEDSLFSSRVVKQSRRLRWIAVGSVSVQGMVLAAFVGAPLMWPEALPALRTAPMVATVSLTKPVVKAEPLKPRRVVRDVSTLQAPRQAVTAAVETRRGGMMTAPSISAEAAPVLALGGGMHSGFVFGTGLGLGTGATAPVVTAAAPRAAMPLRVSSGVSSGMLLSPILPVYPRIAVDARVEGTVVVTATIDKRGRIAGLQVLSGPAMLRAAARDAIKEARYRPYLLNGEPTEVVTTISVNFRMGG